MEDISILTRLPGALLPWYYENRRDLPWRQDREPYHVWLSEIMLQQTRVEAVKGYYARFLAALPTISALAHCDDDKLHKLWEGLGYYSRVRNLKKAAGVILERFGGQFPTQYQDVRALPGIGDYTAGAICSICFGQATPAVDGNVLRVLSRLLNDPTPIDLPAQKMRIRSMLEKVYPGDTSGFTQALMELGATLCGPNRAPDCAHCPCQSFCRGYQLGTAPALPLKSPKRQRRQEDLTVLILRRDGHYALCKRPAQGLLAGLWEFPNVPGALTPSQALETATALGLRPRELLRKLERKHIFTHIQWNMTGYFLEVTEPGEGLTWLTPEEIESTSALPTAFRQFWEETDHV